MAWWKRAAHVPSPLCTNRPPNPRAACSRGSRGQPCHNYCTSVARMGQSLLEYPQLVTPLTYRGYWYAPQTRIRGASAMAALSAQREGMTISNVTQNPSRKPVDKTNLKHTLRIVQNAMLREYRLPTHREKPTEDSQRSRECPTHGASTNSSDGSVHQKRNHTWS